MRPVVGDGNCSFRSISYLITGDECREDKVHMTLVVHIVDPQNWYPLKQYLLPQYTDGMAYVRDK